MASLEIISYRDPELLHNHLQVLRESSHAVPTAADLLAAFFDRAAKFQTSRAVFIDMAIHVVVTLNITLERSVALENRSAIISRLTELIVEGATSDWLSIRSDDGPNMVQIYRYVVRCSTSDSKPTRELFERILLPALRSLAMVVEINHEASACISMELGEYYFMNADFAQAAVHLRQAKALLMQNDESRLHSESCVNKNDGSYKQPEGAYPDPDKRISSCRLEALLLATDGSETEFPFDDIPESIAAQLIDSSIACSTSSSIIARSLWDFLFHSTPIDQDVIAQNGVDLEQFVPIVEQVVDALSTTDLLGSARVADLKSNQGMMIENNTPSLSVFDQNSIFGHSQTDLIELLQFSFRWESNTSIRFPMISGEGYDNIMNCATQMKLKNPEQLLRLFLNSEQSDIAERFARSSPTTSFTVAALLSLIANNLLQSHLMINLDLFKGIFADVSPKRLLSKLKIPTTILLSKLLQCLLKMLLSSIGASTDIIAHFMAIAKVLYASSDFRNSARVLLTIIRIAYKDSFLTGPVLTDPIYYEMLITSLTESGETFDAAVLCQCDNFLDLERGSRLLMTSPRRLQPEMFCYILYPELVETLVYAYDRISPDNNKKQAALNLMSRPIMMAKRNHPQRSRFLDKFITKLLSKPKYCFLDDSTMIAQN